MLTCFYLGPFCNLYVLSVQQLFQNAQKYTLCLRVNTDPGIVGYEWVWPSRRHAIRREEVRLTDERIVTLVIDSRVNEPTVHTPSAIPWRTKQQRTGLQSVDITGAQSNQKPLCQTFLVQTK